jgi:glycosyltransferase involved in cell wall biosynthesis
MQHGLVSIIIATRNVRDLLEKCLHSIEEQSYLAREIIVMDAASTDDTVAFLKRKDKSISHWESKPDNGIYDAWNKALAYTKGEWISFIGADDIFADKESLRKLIQSATISSAVFTSGKAILVNSERNSKKVIGRAWNWKRMRAQQEIIHVGALHHYTLFEKYGNFDATFKIAGDYDFLLRILPNELTSFVPIPIVIVGDGGVSRKNPINVFRESLAVQLARPEISAFRAYRNYFLKRLKYFVKEIF